MSPIFVYTLLNFPFLFFYFFLLLAALMSPIFVYTLLNFVSGVPILEKVFLSVSFFFFFFFSRNVFEGGCGVRSEKISFFSLLVLRSLI